MPRREAKKIGILITEPVINLYRFERNLLLLGTEPVIDFDIYSFLELGALYCSTWFFTGPYIDSDI